MLEPDLITKFVAPLEQLGLPYMVTGSVAGILYGEPRLTHDVDIVLMLPRHRARELASVFPESEFYCPPEDVIVIETQRARRGHFNLIHHASGFKADIYLMGDDPLHRWAMDHLRKLPWSSMTISVAPPEYVILRKLEFFREGGSDKHLRDIRAMIELQADALDKPTVAEWAERLGLSETWRSVAKI